MVREPVSWSRRDLLSGRSAASSGMEGEHHITGLVVHARPERLSSVLACSGPCQASTCMATAPPERSS